MYSSSNILFLPSEPSWGCGVGDWGVFVHEGRCALAHIYVEAYRMFLRMIYMSVFETGSLSETWSSPLKLDWLAGKVPELGSQVHATATSFSSGCKGSKLCSLCLCSKHFTSWNKSHFWNVFLKIHFRGVHCISRGVPYASRVFLSCKTKSLYASKTTPSLHWPTTVFYSSSF